MRCQSQTLIGNEERVLIIITNDSDYEDKTNEGKRKDYDWQTMSQTLLTQVAKANTFAVHCWSISVMHGLYDVTHSRMRLEVDQAP
jgi:hypothetical protein